MRAGSMIGFGKSGFGRQQAPRSRASSADLDTDTPGMSDAFAMTLLVVLPRIGDGIRLCLKAAPAGIAALLVALAVHAMLPERSGSAPQAGAGVHQQDPEVTGSVKR